MAGEADPRGAVRIHVRQGDTVDTLTFGMNQSDHHVVLERQGGDQPVRVVFPRDHSRSQR